MASDPSSYDDFGIIEGTSPAEHYESTEKDKELVKKLDATFLRMYETRLSYEKNWDLYRLYLKGDQLIVHKSTGELVRLTPEDGKRLRSVNNVLRPTARSLVGKLTRAVPTTRVVPPTDDFEDQHGAQVADALLAFLRRKEDLDMVYQEACEYLPWAGNGMIKLFWDRQAGDNKAWCDICDYLGSEDEVGAACPQCSMQREQETQQQAMQFDEQQDTAIAQIAVNTPPGVELSPDMIPEEAMQEPPLQQMGPLPPDQEPPPLKEIRTGDIRIECIDVREFFIEAGVDSMKKARLICHRQALPVSTIRTMFPEFAPFIQEEGGLQLERSAELRHYSGDAYGDLENLDEHAYLEEWHEAPTEMYKYGRVIWKVRDLVLREIESPYFELGRFPFYHFGWDKNQGEFFMEPFLTQAWHRQRELNNNETAIREHTELLLKPKVLIPSGSRISSDEFTATSAQTIKYNRAGGEPTRWDPPAVPVDLWNRGTQLSSDIRQQATVTDADIGMSSSDPNGRAMAIIGAESDQQLGPITRRNNLEWRALHKGALVLAQKYYTPDRTWARTGPDGTEVYHFYEMNLAPGFDVELEEHDGMSTNPAIRFQQSMELGNIGYFVDTQTGALDKKAFARAAKLHVSDKGYNTEATERAAAAQIPARIKQGLPVEPHSYDDPMIFAEVLVAWLRGPGRREQDVMVTQQVEQIWMIYMQWAMAGQMQTQPGQGPSTGVPGGQGGAGPGGPDMSAPGGSPNNPGHMGTDRPIAAGAQQTVAMADQRAEKSAQVTAQREG